MKKIIIVDDHELISKGIRSLIDTLPMYEVIHEARNGQQLMKLLNDKKNIPNIILLDINMPVMSGFETMEWLTKNHPTIPVLALTINNDEESVLKMLRLGVKGYLLKDTDSNELVLAMDTILGKGYYCSDLETTVLRNQLKPKQTLPAKEIFLTEREKELLQYISTDLTYKEIAEKMFVSPKTIDGYREDLFQKFDVKSRIGLVVFAIKNKLIEID